MTGGSLVLLIVLLGEIKERASNSGVVGDEPMIEIGKVEEGSYFLDFCGG